MSHDQSMINALAKGRVAIVGDVVLDHYVIGSVARISPEAPVPVLHVARDVEAPGGAANVAANVVALGGAVDLIGVAGEDPGAARLVGILEQMGRINLGLVPCGTHPTITKTRYVSGQQQIVRVDRESVAEYAPEVSAQVIAEIKARIASCDCLVLSDYGKGVLSDAVIAAAIAAAREADKPVIVDPKRPTFEPYRGASFITPNRKELTAATRLPCGNDEEAVVAAAAAMAQADAAILLTRSEQGMSLYRQGQCAIHLKAEAREVFDVSGAGDTVVASLALGLAVKLPVAAAMRIANTAAGVVVGKLGTATCSVGELRQAWARQVGRPSERPSAEAPGDEEGLTPLDAAKEIRAGWEQEGFKVGFANGCFDLLHPGHVSLLRQAAAACDRLIVAINSDASVSALKGPTRPVQDQDARAQVLKALKGVDLVVAFDDPTPLALVEALYPDVIVKGADYKEEDVVGGAFVKARGGRVLLADLIAGQSTSALVKRANSGGG
jgi:D-beta-D-heptose 7-phosphate kinase/D-beta-D-heptose 1-phosphate adenosyltransferase